MKKAIFCVLTILVILIFSMSYITIHGRQVRQNELNVALENSMEKAVSLLLENDGKPETEEEWIEMFCLDLSMQIASASDLTVNILDADFEKGLLQVEAILSYRNPIGTTSTVSSERMVLVEQYVH